MVVKQKAGLEAQTKKIPPCLICRNDSVKLLRTGIREDPTWPVYRCPRCFLQYIIPKYSDTKAYYQDQYRDRHDAVIGQRLTPEERFRQYWSAHLAQAGRLKEWLPEGCSVLEIGCSSGYLLDHLQQGGYDVYGAEWNSEDAAWVRDVGGVPCEEGTLDEIYPGQQFTAIVALQVLEHQPDPIAFLRQVKDRLIGGGYLYLELPSASEALLTVYGVPEYQNFFYRESHITYWQVETISSVLSALGFEASVSVRQRYGLLDHLHWMMNRGPMPSFKEATSYLDVTPKAHPLHAIMARTTGKLDKEYRLQIETLKAADTIIVKARRRTI